jgi:hypothetical protein
MLWENLNPEETLKEILKTENLCHFFKGDHSTMFSAVEPYVSNFQETI